MRVYTDRSLASKSDSMPRKWKNKYGTKASIIEVLPNDQYLLRNVETGKTIKRSGAQMTKRRSNDKNTTVLTTNLCLLLPLFPACADGAEYIDTLTKTARAA